MPPSPSASGTLAMQLLRRHTSSSAAAAACSWPCTSARVVWSMQGSMTCASLDTASSCRLHARSARTSSVVRTLLANTRAIASKGSCRTGSRG
jgi:hypothetical protein